MYFQCSVGQRRLSVLNLLSLEAQRVRVTDVTDVTEQPYHITQANL